MNPKNSPRRGATSVEVAICLPVLFVMLFGCYEVARANFLSQAAESAAYEGARLGILPGATEAKIREGVEFVMESCGATQFNVTVTPNVFDNNTERVKVEVSVSMRQNTLLLFQFFDDPVFVGACEMKRETL